MTRFLERLRASVPDTVLVGTESMDDAGVLKISDDLALVQTVDLITPAVDDPALFGKLAATNSLSDVYAMGATPISAMNVVCFPKDRLAPGTIDAMLAGALEVLDAASVPLLGGHTMKDTEVKFGLSVTGTVHPERFWANNTAVPGDVLVLSKPIGAGVLFQALKAGHIQEAELAPQLAQITTLNRAAAEAASALSVHACTDITGFGLAGHVAEMTLQSQISIELFLERIPLYTRAREFAAAGVRPGLTADNIDGIADAVASPVAELPALWQTLACDPQTSGGLLFAVPEAEGEQLIERLREAKTPVAAIIGRVTDRQAWRVKLSVEA